MDTSEILKKLQRLVNKLEASEPATPAQAQENTHQNIGGGVVVSRATLTRLQENFRDAPSKFVRALLRVLFTDADLENKTLFGRQANSHSESWIGPKEGGCSPSTRDVTLHACSWKEYPKKKDVASQEDRNKPGRPRVSGEEEDALIIAAAVTDPFLNAKEIKQELGLHTSCDTVRRRLKQAGLQNCAAAQKPFLTDNRRRQQLEFARAYERWGVDEWSQVIFTDESTFCTRWDQQQRVWRPLNCRYRPEYTQNVLSSGRCSVSVWGAISKGGLGPLVRIEGTFNASSYCDIVNKTLVPYALDGPFPDGFYWLQHDRSPVHTARLAEAALDSCGVLRRGADLNPIENVWGLIKRCLGAQSRRLPNADALCRSIQEAWEALSREPETTRALYASMPRRIAEVIAAEGHYTGH
ncbi:hypothetical protein HPB52_008594 [Rhipicephalus sanguineus]|uniref:Transposable element n=1 Tax=Rhipicephalus sanguineus TaxID=34632 RepID=A0A9D4PXU1_RHISA|nr:hypothetical protein HPB52_008594 [Rhipicephalus sanguineus]